MTEETFEDRRFTERAVEAFIRIALIGILAAWCFEIVRPFLVSMIWGVIIAIGLFPAHRRLCDALKGRRATAAVILSLVALTLLLVPVFLLSQSVVDGAQVLVRDFGQGTLRIPPPPGWVQGLPLVGDGLERLWTLASTNLEAALAQFRPQLQSALGWLAGAAAGAGFGILQFLFALGIAGVLLAHAEEGKGAAVAVARRLAGDSGVEFVQLGEATVRSVTRGILGVALIQSTLAGLGWLAVGVPAAGLWALVALILSTVQIGILPITIPILVYVYASADTLTFVLFLVWSLLVGTIDNILKPILLGRGVKVPMVVIFVGAIGGFLSGGIIGLFVGSVVLVLSYELVLAWVRGTPDTQTGRSDAVAAPDR
jgi:predicted PurR-regulated permease PerM